MLQWLRIRTVMPYIRGRLFDIGCGNNKLVKKYGNGVGIDKGTPSVSGNFDTITLIASLNYMVESEREIYLKCFSACYPNASIIVTCRRIWKGLSKEYIEKLFKRYDYYLTYYRPFFPFNGLYIFKKKDINGKLFRHNPVLQRV